MVALVNRMGPGTCDFIDRIRTIFSGWRPGDRTSTNGDSKQELLAPFSFQAVYSINDLQTTQIAKLQDALTTLFDHYEQTTEVPSFRSATQQVRKYFESQQVTTWEFSEGAPQPKSEFDLDVPHGHGRTSVRVKTLEGRFSLLSHALVTNDDYNAVIDQIGQMSDRRALYRLFALLLLDLSHLRLTGQFEKLRESILSRVSSERDHRCQLERDTPKDAQLVDKVKQAIDIETNMFFGLALVSYMDHGHDDHVSIAVRALTEGRSAEEWFTTPINLLQHLAEERVAWVISMLLRLTPKGISQKNGHKELVSRIRVFQRFLGNRKEPRLYLAGQLSEGEVPTKRQARAIRGLIRRAKDNLDMLLTECGEHQTGTYHSCVRFLHSHLVSTGRHHSPLVTSMNAVINALDEALRDAAEREKKQGKTVKSEQPLRCALPELQFKVEEAIHSVGIMEQIAEASAFLFRFTPTAPNAAVRYVDCLEPNSMRSELRTIRLSLLEVRRLNAISRSTLGELIRLRGRVLEDLYGEGSLLRRTAKRYVVPLERTFAEAVDYAADLFKKRKYRQAWLPIQETLKGKSSDHFVLIDPSLAREVFRNITTNLRHTVKGLSLESEEYGALVSFRIETEPPSEGEDDPTERVLLRVECRGKAFDEQSFLERLPGSTWEHHQYRISQFGGDLQIEPLQDEEGCVVKLRLYSRDKQATVLKGPDEEEGE